jgi:DNA invertase Pin-like site-specific DNA recombinase
MHSCDNPGCVNPRHLSIGSQSENLRQASRRGRSGAARGSRQAFAKLNEDDVNSIVMAVRLGAKQKDIADEFGVHATTISKIMRGASWKHVEG